MTTAVEAVRPRGGPFVFAISTISALAGLLFGYDTGVISGAILFVQEDFHLSTFQEETVVAAVLLGALIGAAIGARLADRFGRRNALIQVGCLFVLGALGTALTSGTAWLAAGRVVVGIAIGIASFTAPLYISEISPAQVRGKLVSLNQLMITIGILVSYLADYGLAASRGWRWMFALAAVPACILLAGLLFVPESPRWYVRQLLHERAREVLSKIRQPFEVDPELAEIEASLTLQQGSWRELLSPALRPALAIGIGLAIFQQFTGINTVIYYAPTIFQLAGLESHSAAILATAGVGVVNVLMTVLALELLDRVGRRPLLLYGLIGMILSLALLGIGFLTQTPTPVLAWLSLLCVMAYVACFAISLGPIFWLMIAEIYPLKLRSRAMGLATMANWGSNLLVALTFLSLLHTLGRPWTFWLYAIVGVVAWIFVLRMVPETKGKTLEQIEAGWRSHREAERPIG
ncbi:MAG TPA: sugar porter family MFS transporter [Candidatus Acidoferrales bacterium]|nr:sugar porter family MFS transporter [Candidatus Acidoferrales bacterium]